MSKHNTSLGVEYIEEFLYTDWKASLEERHSPGDALILFENWKSYLRNGGKEITYTHMIASYKHLFEELDER